MTPNVVEIESNGYDRTDFLRALGGEQVQLEQCAHADVSSPPASGICAEPRRRSSSTIGRARRASVVSAAEGPPLARACRPGSAPP